ncbi:MAG TPA: SDR family NAD(P)-dependent oxidoreductase [Chloroflexota bacterium]|nr:SDR family NAD(P)-dependent oxidoreductase [Chloroflexota bacterium]
MDLKDKIAIVTGGATGIGKACSLALARQGVALAVNYSRSEADARETVKEIVDAGGRAMSVKADVAYDDEVRAMVGAVVREFGGVDLLVNSAGTTRFIPLSDLESVTDEIWDDIMAVNVKGIFNCARAVAPHMRERGAGAIVSIASLSGYTGDGSSLPYAVSKAAAIGLTRSLAKALAPQIRVCSVAPGIVKTRWVAGREHHVERLSSSALLQRTATPEDVAAMVIALFTQDAITGQTIVLDAGQFLGVS